MLFLGSMMPPFMFVISTRGLSFLSRGVGGLTRPSFATYLLGHFFSLPGVTDSWGRSSRRVLFAGYGRVHPERERKYEIMDLWYKNCHIFTVGKVGPSLYGLFSHHLWIFKHHQFICY